jgi:methylmalonyl-CoA mutase N-terminal domain/subunit
MGKDKLDWKTSSGIEFKKFYEASDSSIGREPPGVFPYTRGLHADMYRGKLWTMRQYAGFGSAALTNERYHYLLERGTTGLSVAFDLPTQMGRDPDHLLSRGEVGRVGVSISTVDDMETLFRGIPLEKVSISMTINSTASILLAFLLVLAERRGVAWADLRGTIQNDVLKEYIARGTYIFPPRPALRIITDIFDFCAKKVPNWNTISISGYHIREAGSTAVQEIAYTLADGIAYVDAAVAKGLPVDHFGPRLAFFFNCHNNFLEEVSKFRAARKLWATIMSTRFNAKDPKSMMLRFHTQTAGSSLTAQQPLNNVVRTTMQALAAVFGGTQSLHTNGFDEALGLPTEESATLALRTQQIIADESGVAWSADPLGGSYLIESLTDQLIERAQAEIAKIDAMGGMLAAIELGYPQREIEAAAYDAQRGIESGDSVVVGVNRYAEGELKDTPVLKIDPETEKIEVAKLGRFKEVRRNNGGEAVVSNVLMGLKRSASGGGDMMADILACARAGATLGEISDALRDVFGEYRSTY